MIGGGAFEWVLGQKMFKPTLFILGTLSVLAITMFFFYAWILPYSTANWLVWVIGGIGLVLGLVAGFFLAKLARIGVAALGAWVGVILALIIHEAFLYATHSMVVFYLLVIGLGIVFGLIALWQYKIVLIFGTAFLGSYAMVRGVSLFIGGYPNEFTLISKI